jgi:hypothetical protein
MKSARGILFAEEEAQVGTVGLRRDFAPMPVGFRLTFSADK